VKKLSPPQTSLSYGGQIYESLGRSSSTISEYPDCLGLTAAIAAKIAAKISDSHPSAGDNQCFNDPVFAGAHLPFML
jgi:hypothetical protein